jgi:streptogramin lyase
MYGGVFYTDRGRDKIGFLNPYPKATLVEWPTIAPGSDPYGIAVDKDGNIWFTESGSTDGRSRIGKLNPMTNVLTEYRIPSDNAEPRGILVDNVAELGRVRPGFAGRIWVAEHRGNKIAKFDPEGNTFVEFTRPVSGAPHGLAMDLTASPKIWFTDEGGARIGRIDPNIAIAATSTNFISTATTSITTMTSTVGATTSTTIAGTSATTVVVTSRVTAITSTWTSTTASTYYEVTETSQVLIGTTYATVTEVSTSTRSTTVPATWTETITVAPSTSTALVSAITTTTVSTTTMTIPITATSTSLYLTTTYSTSTTTTTQTVVTTATYITAAAGPPGAPAIPGFPIESIAIGLSAGLSALALAGRGRRRRA